MSDASWPLFLRQRDSLGLGRYWPSLFDTYADWQLAVCDPLDHVVAVGQTVPFRWDGTAADLPESLAAILARAAGAEPPNTLSALAALVDPKHRGRGLSAIVIRAMADRARAAGFGDLVAPVRPMLKASYPLAPMERYVAWTDDDGLPFDPWMRVHARLGATIVRVIPVALVIEATVAAWEEWTEMKFPESGAYVVPGALQPVVVDRESDTARYEDPNVWMRHSLGGGSRPPSGAPRS